MKLVPTFYHGLFDYIGGVTLLAAPNIFGFAGLGGAAELVPRVLGIVVLLQALATDYELGVFKVLPMRMHIMNDYIAGVFLALSPWLFGFNTEPRNMWVPHVVVGLVVLVLTALTETVPRRRIVSRMT